MRLWFLLLLLPLASSAQDQVRERMETSLNQQRESVRKQIALAKPAEPSWYTVPWPKLDWPLPVSTATTSAGWRANCEPLKPAEVEPLLREAAATHGLETAVLRAVMERESAFYPCATSSKGALGLMQLMPQTAADFGVVDPFDPRENMDAGAKLLASLLGRYAGDLKLALAAYNAGPARVDEHKGVPPFRETRDYIGSILGAIQ